MPCSDGLLDVQVREVAYRDEEGFAFALLVVAVAGADAVEVVLAACVDLASFEVLHSASSAVASIHCFHLDAVDRWAAKDRQVDQAVARLAVV